MVIYFIFFMLLLVITVVVIKTAYFGPPYSCRKNKNKEQQENIVEDATITAPHKTWQQWQTQISIKLNLSTSQELSRCCFFFLYFYTQLVVIWCFCFWLASIEFLLSFRLYFLASPLHSSIVCVCMSFYLYPP